MLEAQQARDLASKWDFLQAAWLKSMLTPTKVIKL